VSQEMGVGEQGDGTDASSLVAFETSALVGRCEWNSCTRVGCRYSFPTLPHQFSVILRPNSKTALSWILCRGFGVSVLVASCSGISALTTLADVPSEFHSHRVSFTDPAPARRGASVSSLTVPCGPRALSTAAIAGILTKIS
jgi:hypothetical protein